MKFTKPDVLPTDRAELDGLAEQAAAEIAVFQARFKAGDEFTQEDVERFEFLADAYDEITAASSAADPVEVDPARLSTLIERTATKPETEETPEETEDAPLEEPAPLEPDIPAAVQPVPVAAAITPVSFAATTKSEVPNPDNDTTERPWNLLPSAPNFAQHKGKGATLRDIAMSIASVDPGSGQGIQQTGSAGRGLAKQAIASISRPQVTLEATNEAVIYEYLQKLGKEIPGHGAATAEGLVAAGGWCSPSQTVYTFCDVPPASGLISLPDFPFDMSRGGVRVPVSPDISALLTDLWHYTETELEAVDSGGDPTAVKPIIELPCPEDWLEWRLEAIGWAAKAGILQRQAWPEAIENALQQIQVAHQHRVSRLSVAKMVAGSGTPKLVPGTVLGATSASLNAIAINAVNLRINSALSDSAVIEGVAPVWMREVFRADLALRDGKDMLSVSDAEIDSWFAVRNVYLQYVRDWQTGGSDQPGDLTLQEWPATAQVLLYPAGTWFRQLANVITLGVQYPLEQLQLNQYTHIFTEDSFQVGKRCNASIIVELPLCVTGSVGARKEITCDTGSI